MGKSSEQPRRVPIHTPYMRRDSVYNPEYLDAERALARFTPLIESTLQHMRGWVHSNSEYDVEDMRSMIQMEFLRLHDQYNPAYGVDFPGYIKLNLERRVRYYIMRSQKHVGHEVLAFASEITDRYIESLADENAENELGRVECVTSVPVDAIEDDMYRDLARHILLDHEDIHALAERYRVSVRSMAAKIDAAGRYIRTMMEQNSTHEEAEAKESEEPADSESPGAGT